MAQGTDEGDVLVDHSHEGVALVTLHRPPHLNALTSDMLDEIYHVFEQLGRDSNCRVIVVTGAGKGFCAGDDLQDYRPPPWVPTDLGPLQLNMYQQKHVAELVPRMRAVPQPIIAAINGATAGAGYALALGADLRFAATSALFVDAFVKIGASGAELGLSWLLQRIVGATRAAALAKADEIIANTPFGTWMGKATLWSNLEISSLAAAIDLEARTQILTLGTEDAKEQLAAFREKRAPRYTNH